MPDFAISAERVESMFHVCLYGGTNPARRLTVDGITANYWLDRNYVDAYRQEIREMLATLPGEFKASGGGGWSFLNLCTDRNGTQWTGEHRVMDMLVILGIAAGEAEYQPADRALWPALPGGLPYVTVKQ